MSSRLPLDAFAAAVVLLFVFAGRPSAAEPQAAPANYVPEPQPVPCKYDLGVYYFPGWDTMGRWAPITDYPERKPLLGWYDEANPECVDWQIKWSVEHGIRFFMVDWYWDDGNRYLEHWIRQGYANAKYRRYLKWCVMWANHNPKGSHSVDDWRKVTQYWIDNYFGMEEYYRVDGRPVVILFAPTNLTRDLGGSEAVAKLFAMSQEMARKAGHKGIFFVAIEFFKSPEACARLKTEGYEATTSYHVFYSLEKKYREERRIPFSEVVQRSPEFWRREDSTPFGVGYWPVVETGWANAPWAGKERALEITGRTPEAFGQLCRTARAYADEHNEKILAIGPWNEWGEGSYVEPCAEFGFGQLDALRAAFCEPGNYPPNVTPADLGRGPYDLPAMHVPLAWNFDADGDLQGWEPNGQLKLEIRGGKLRARSRGTDPFLGSPPLTIQAEDVRQLVVRIKSNAADQVQVFWKNKGASGYRERASVRIDVPDDGAFHDCVVDLDQQPEWHGEIEALRLDPTSRPDAEFEIDSITLR